MSDMLDVIHFFFEDDSNYASGEQAEARSKMRSNIYHNLYDTTYRYEIKGSKTNQINPEDLEFAPEDDASMRDIKPFDPKKAPTKGFIPPTAVDDTSTLPFGSVLDAPMR